MVLICLFLFQSLFITFHMKFCRDYSLDLEKFNTILKKGGLIFEQNCAAKILIRALLIINSPTGIGR